mmetsp:Transcript_18511/g.43961  ORF Transcript_18511/g.43961 Transcript_18511/m.43961 type:complete len:271 (+) Transcript_18511:1247-2059(+)
MPRQGREQAHRLIRLGLIRRVGDLLHLPADVRQRQRAAVGVEHLDLKETAAALHHDMPRALEGLQRVALGAGQPRAAEEVVILRHVERVGAHRGGAVEGDAARQQPHELLEGRRLRLLGLRVEDVGLEVTRLERAQEGHRSMDEASGAADLRAGRARVIMEAERRVVVEQQRRTVGQVHVEPRLGDKARVAQLILGDELRLQPLASPAVLELRHEPVRLCELRGRHERLGGGQKPPERRFQGRHRKLGQRVLKVQRRDAGRVQELGSRGG